jgi:hypothetical protein
MRFNFLNVAFLGETYSWDFQISQVEIKREFSLANVLTTWKHFHLQVKNLD